MNPLRCLGALAALLLSGLPARTAAADLLRGQLENGVHFLILPHGDDRAQVSVRLFVQAGSLDEAPSEMGYAHFVEHMAFDGTTHYPAGAIGQLFQRLGLSWGPDLNANTHHTHTVYLLELPAGHPEDLPTALGVLRDYADGIQFPADEVASEAGVVLSEMHQREGESERATQQVNRVLYSSTLLPQRLVIGTEAAVRGATAETLRAFYRRCYTAGRMTVVVVGPVDPEATRAEIGRQFASMAAESGVAPVALGLPAVPAGLDATCFTDPDLKGAVSRYVLTGPVPPDTAAGRAEELTERVVISILNQRLQARRDQEPNRFGVAHVSLEREDFAPDARREIYVQTASQSWDRAIATIENELRYARQLGFRPNELADAAGEARALSRERILVERTAPSKLLAAGLVQALAEHRIWLPAEAAAAEDDATLAQLDVIRAHHAFRNLFPDQVGHLVVRGGKAVEVTPDKVLAAFARSARRPVQALAEEASVEFAYGDLGPPAALVERRRDEVLGIDLLRFANGVRLNVRQSTSEPGRFQLRIVLGRGTPDIPAAMSAFPALADGLLNASELGRQTNSEVARVMAVKGIVCQNSMVDGAGSVLLSGPVAELPFAFRYLAARLTDTQFSRDRYSTALSYYAGTREREFNTPEAAAAAECLYRLTNDDERVYLPRVDVAAGYRFPAVYEWLERHWLNGPIEVGVVGDVSAEAVSRAAAVTLGDLPKRQVRESPGAPKRVISGPLSADLDGSMVAGSAGACLDWPVVFSGEPRELAATELAADVLADRLRVALREKLGATYTPETAVRRDRFQRSFGYIQARLNFDSDRAVELTGRAIEIADRFAKRGVTREEFDRLRAPRVSRARASLESDRWWLDSIVAFAQSQPEILEQTHALLPAYEGVEMFDVNRAAAALAQARACAVIVHPAAR